MKTEIFPMSRQGGMVIQDAQNELLLYDLKTNQAFCLNQTSALIYEMCDGTKSVSQISRSLSTKLKSNVSEEFVWFALDQLKKENLIENNDEIPNHFAGMSRRNVIKKIGLGSMMALPIVVSIVAPAQVSAQSCSVGAGETFMTATENCGVATQTTTCSTAGMTVCCTMTTAVATPISPSDCTASGGVTCVCP